MSKVTYKTADGQTFESYNYAKLHARSLKNSTITPVESTSSEGDQDNSQGPELLTKADEIIAFAKDTEDADTLVLYLEAENGKKKPRVSVVEAVEARLIELNQD